MMVTKNHFEKANNANLFSMRVRTGPQRWLRSQPWSPQPGPGSPPRISWWNPGHGAALPCAASLLCLRTPSTGCVHCQVLRFFPFAMFLRLEQCSGPRVFPNPTSRCKMHYVFAGMRWGTTWHFSDLRSGAQTGKPEVTPMRCHPMNMGVCELGRSNHLLPVIRLQPVRNVLLNGGPEELGAGLDWGCHDAWGEVYPQQLPMWVNPHKLI